MFNKHAKINTPLQPHQQRIVDRISSDDQPGLVVAHGLGTGKTLSSIAAADALNMPAHIVTPAALQSNYRKELKNHRAEGDTGFDIHSLQRLTRTKDLPNVENGLMVVDEAHRLRDPMTSGNQYFKRIPSAKRLLLTGSPIYNHPADLSSLVNMAAGSKQLPEYRKDFEDAYTRMEKVSPGFWGKLRGIQAGEKQVLRNEKHLKSIYDKWVDYHENTNTADFPTSQEEDVKVPMSEKQQDVYDGLLEKAPAWVQYKIKNGLPPSKQEKQLINEFLTTQRQVAGSPHTFVEGMDMEEAVKHTPKIHEALRRLKAKMQENPNHKAVVYSNYLESGLNPYKHMLDKEKIPYGMFTGVMKKKDREQMVKDYNANKIKALLLSSAGGEGLDLKGTRQIQVLDPHFNEEKIRQIIGRGVRYKSHADLPEDQRNVHIERYLTQNRPTFWNRMTGSANPEGTSEEYLAQLSKDKLKLNDQVIELLRNSKKTAATTEHRDFLVDKTYNFPGSIGQGIIASGKDNYKMYALKLPDYEGIAAEVFLQKSPRNTYHVKGMYVPPELRNLGLAKAVLNFAAKHNPGARLQAVPDPYKDQALNREQLTDVYKNLGFAPLEKYPSVLYKDIPKFSSKRK